jgi:hypothetical protein
MMLRGSRPTNGGLSFDCARKGCEWVTLHDSPRASAEKGKGGEVLAVGRPRILIGIDREAVVVIQARKSCRILALYLESMVTGKLQ